MELYKTEEEKGESRERKMEKSFVISLKLSSNRFLRESIL